MATIDAASYPDEFREITIPFDVQTNDDNFPLFLSEREIYIDEVRIRTGAATADATLALAYAASDVIHGGVEKTNPDHTPEFMTVITSGVDCDITTTPNCVGRYLTDTFVTTSAAAKAQITMTENDNATGDTVTITDTAGRTVVYKCIASGGDANGTIQSDGSVAYVQNDTETTAATNIAAAINHANGHGASITASASSATVTLTQDVAGHAGNTEILTSDNTHTTIDHNFGGGRDAHNAGDAYTVPAGFALFVKDTEGNAAADVDGSVYLRYRTRQA